MTVEISEREEEAPPQEPEIQLILSLGLKEEDAEEVLNLASKCQNFTPDHLMLAEESAWEAAFSTGQPYRLFVKAHVLIDDEQHFIGFASFGRILNEEDYYELYLIAVDDDYQGIGIGTALIDEVERQIALYGGSMVFCEMSEHRSLAPVHSFFEEIGYDRQSHYYRFFVPAQGNIVYAKEIESNEDSDY